MAFSSPLISHIKSSSSPSHFKMSTNSPIPSDLIPSFSNHKQQFVGRQSHLSKPGASSSLSLLSSPNSPPNLDICLFYPDTAPPEISNPQVNTWLRRHHFAQLKDISKSSCPTPIYPSLDDHWSVSHEKSCQKSVLNQIKHHSDSIMAHFKPASSPVNSSPNSLDSIFKRVSTHQVPGSSFSSECPNKFVSDFSALNHNFPAQKKVDTYSILHNSSIDSQASSNGNIHFNNAIPFDDNDDQIYTSSTLKSKRRRTNSNNINNYVSLSFKHNLNCSSNPSLSHKNACTTTANSHTSGTGSSNTKFTTTTKTLLPSPSLIQDRDENTIAQNNSTDGLLSQNSQPKQVVLQPPSPPTSPNSNNSANTNTSLSIKANSSSTLTSSTSTTTHTKKSPNSSATTHHTFHSKRKCISCGSDQSPCWRPSWSVSEGQLCNSCGLRYKKTNARCLNKSCGRVPAKGEWLTIKNNAVKGPDGDLLYHCFYCGGQIEVKKQ